MRIFALCFLLACAPRTTGDWEELASAASSDEFRVASHPVVGERHARLVHTSKGRLFMEHALANRADYPGIAVAIRERGLPPHLEAVAFVESGFSNIAARPPRLPAGGVWQFIPSTAEEYGLRVDNELDERMDEALATQAALSLLEDLHRNLGDWGLAIAAYNVGETRVREAMAEHDTDDVWQLIEEGALPTYAADVMAAAAVLEL